MNLRWGRSPSNIVKNRRRANERQKLAHLQGRLQTWAYQTQRLGKIPTVRTWFPGMEQAYLDYGVTEDMYIQQYGHGFPKQGAHLRQQTNSNEQQQINTEDQQTEWERANDPRWMSMCRLEHMCIVDGHKLLPEEDWFEHCITHAREHFGRRTNLATPAGRADSSR